MSQFLLILSVYISLGLVVPSTALAEFYKYRDESGKTHFVDDIGKIPPRFRDDLETYEEKQDHLSEQEKMDLDTR